MRIIHTGGFSKMERKQWRVIIFSNLVNAFQILLAAMDEQDTEFEDEDNFVRTPLSKPPVPLKLTILIALG